VKPPGGLGVEVAPLPDPADPLGLGLGDFVEQADHRETINTATIALLESRPLSSRAGAGNRTPDPLLTMEVLCRLSYSSAAGQSSPVGNSGRLGHSDARI
jgi:hypothetical protein